MKSKDNSESGHPERSDSNACIAPAPLTFLAALVLALIVPARAETPPAAIPFSAIGAKATADYQGDALGITATSDGARLRCGFQKLEGRATTEGLWLESTDPGSAGRLRLIATAVGRQVLECGSPLPLSVEGDPFQCSGGLPQSTTRSRCLLEPWDGRARDSVRTVSATTPVFPRSRRAEDCAPYLPEVLPCTGTVSVADKLVKFTRPGVTEEYSVSVDGLRQDFVIAAPPAGAGDLRVELALRGARAEAAAGGVKLRLEGSGRTLAYSRLRAEDATGRELAACLEVLSADRLAVSVADANAIFPVRIDPTFSDADWVSLNGLPGAIADVFAIAVGGDGTVYAGGYFDFIGTVPANYVAKWNGSAWSALGSGMDGPVLALAVSGTDLYAGGGFTTAGGVPAWFIAKWDGSAWSALGSGMNSGVRALAVSGNDLYAGGDFTTAGEVTANYIAKWNGSAWSALGSGMYDGVYVPYVHSLAVSGTDLYAGGRFNSAGGAPANCIAKWNGTTWSALGSGMNYPVHALAVRGNDLYAGGEFSTAGGVTTWFIAKWDGSIWSALGSGMNGYVYALGLSGSDLYAGGGFSTANGVLADGGVPALCIAKWNGSVWSAMGASLNGIVRSLAVSGTNLYAGGEFDRAGEVAANRVAKWDGSAWSALGLGLGSGVGTDVYALATSGSDLYAGGNFTTAGGVPAYYIARWDGSAWSALGSGMGSVAGSYQPASVYALAVSGTDLYAGGTFTTAGGVTAYYIAKWNGSAWSALGSGMNAEVNALAFSGSDLYVAGRFTRVTNAGGAAVTVNCIAKWDGHAWSALGSGFRGGYGFPAVEYPYVSALAVSGNSLYAGGYFTNAGGISATNIAKWDGSTWSPLGSGIGNSDRYGELGYSTVFALAAIGTDLYAGGKFYTAGGVTALRIAKWDGTAWSALGSGLSSGGADAVVYAGGLAVDGEGHLFVGGSFFLAGTKASPYITQANVGSGPAILIPPQSQTAEISSTVTLKVHVKGYPPPCFLWFLNGTNLISCSTDPRLELGNLDFSHSGAFIVVVTNLFGAVTSSPAMLNVIPAVERRPVPCIGLMGEVGSALNVEYTDTFVSTANWLPLDKVTLTNSTQFYYDPSAPPPPQRFYRAWQSGIPSVAPALNLPFLVPAITVTGSVGSKVRVDGINQFGPTDAWFTLDTVTLTNTSQLYFDITAPGQPQRLYRLVPVP